MLASNLPLLARVLITVAAGLAAGVANAIAGGGTFITFPALLATGIPALQANVSTSVGVAPSYLGNIRGFAPQLRTHRALVRSLVPSCVLGAAAGCTLLLVFPATTFRSVVPWLIGAGTLLFALSPWITKRLAHLDHDHPSRRIILLVGVFLVSIYGGYFGAGLGILLLAVMAVSLPLSLNELQGIRSVLATIINLCAAVIFIIRGHLATTAVLLLLVSTLIGGFVGARVLRRMSPATVRYVVIVMGAATAIRLAW